MNQNQESQQQLEETSSPVFSSNSDVAEAAPVIAAEAETPLTPAIDTESLLHANATTNSEPVGEEANTTTEKSNNKFLRFYGFSNAKEFWIALKQEFMQIFHISWPMIISNLCYSAMTVTDMSFVGHLPGPQYLAAAALANAYSFSISFFAIGLVAGLETLASQAYGAKNFKLVAVILLRCIFVSTVGCIPVLILLMLSKQFFTLVGLDQEVSGLAATFVYWLAPGIWPVVITRVFTRYLASQEVVILPMVFGILAVLLNFVLNFFLVSGVGYQGLGFSGAAIATTISRWIQMFLILIVHWRASSIKVDWIGGWKDAVKLQGLWEYVKLALPGALAITLEVCGFEITTIISGYLGAVSLAAHSIILNVATLTFMLPFGISIACSVRVGSMLGANNAKKAKFSASLALILCVLIMAVNGAILVIVRNLIAWIWTSETAVIAAVAFTIPVAASFQIFDGLQVCCCGILRGMGRQHLPLLSNVVGYYVVGIPLGCVLGFLVKWDLSGLWVGLASALAVVALVLTTIIVFFINWESEAQKAQKRVSEFGSSSEKPQAEELASTEETPAGEELQKSPSQISQKVQVEEAI